MARVLARPSIAGALCVACTQLPPTGEPAPVPTSTSTSTPTPASPPPSITPSTSVHPNRLTVHFYDVGQGLAALVDLPDGRHILVDAGDSPTRRGCGDTCATAHRHLLAALSSDLHGAPLDLLWITHQHSDHIGGVPDILHALEVGAYVDNGTSPREPEVLRAHRAADERGVAVHLVDPDHTASPIPDSTTVKLRPIVPPSWPPSCSHDPNECSIGLRIDFSASSVLFTGDAEHDEEMRLDPHGAVTLLQVGHHGSDTSTSPAFLSKVRPSYAVIAAGKPGGAQNVDYCHPRALIVRRLSRVLGGAQTRPLNAFDGDRCSTAKPSDWVIVSASERLWATSRDGDVTLVTTGDGKFARVPSEAEIRTEAAGAAGR